MTLEQHVHCAECRRAIALEVVDKQGVRTAAKIHAGKQAVLAQGPDNSFVPLVVDVPLCDECDARISAESSGAAGSWMLSQRGPQILARD